MSHRRFVFPARLRFLKASTFSRPTRPHAMPDRTAALRYHQNHHFIALLLDRFRHYRIVDFTAAQAHLLAALDSLRSVSVNSSFSTSTPSARRTLPSRFHQAASLNYPLFAPHISHSQWSRLKKLSRSPSPGPSSMRSSPSSKTNGMTLTMPVRDASLFFGLLVVPGHLESVS